MYPYQELTLYELGTSNKVCIIASRNAAKTFMIALYACCMAILYPGIQIVIGSATMKQAKIIITEKIQKELFHWSANLRKEIKTIYSSIHTAAVVFHNG
jgi:cytochrome b561